ncbi:hypothetical protein M0802_002206 [Mischocyttarus mexicanus]|nr:hypothetical protein M0802_002206 [Mischocyttarus mexicanus]
MRKASDEMKTSICPRKSSKRINWAPGVRHLNVPSSNEQHIDVQITLIAGMLSTTLVDLSATIVSTAT